MSTGQLAEAPQLLVRVSGGLSGITLLFYFMMEQKGGGGEKCLELEEVRGTSF